MRPTLVGACDAAGRPPFGPFGADLSGSACERCVTVATGTPHDVVMTDGVDNLAAMTETEDIRVIDESVIDEAVRLIDAGLSDLLHRELVSTDEVADLLLDVRTLLTAPVSEQL